MSYSIESFIKEVIHNANEEIVVGVNNDQVITGKKTFVDNNRENQNGTIYIGTKSDNTGAFKLSSEVSGNFSRALLIGNGSVHFSADGEPNHGYVQLDYRSTSEGIIGHFSPEYSGYYYNDLGTNEYIWNTLYCKKLSDGTTTKTMTDVLNKQDKLTSGDNITISEDNVISATVPTKTSQLTNDSGYLVNADLPLVTYSDSKLSGGTELKSIQVGDDKWNIPTSVKSVTTSKETWTFTLSDGSTVTKTIVTGITVA